jgi:hypothetical protein
VVLALWCKNDGLDHGVGHLVEKTDPSYQCRAPYRTYAVILRVHRAQEATLEQAEVAAPLSFPDTATMGQRIAGRLTPPMGWHQVLSTAPHIPLPEALMDADPGAQPFPARAIERLQRERRL